MRKSLFGSLASVTLAAGVVFAATNAHAQVFSDSFADQTKQQTQQKPGAGNYLANMTPDGTAQFTVRTAANESGASLPVTCSAPYARDTVAMSAGHMFTKSIINVTVGSTYCLSAWVRADISGGAPGNPYIGVQETAMATGFPVTTGEHWLLAASGGFATNYGVGDNATVIPLDGKWHWVSKAFQPTATTLLIKSENYDNGTFPTQTAPAARSPVDIDELTLTAGACPAAAPTLPLTNCTTGNLCDNATNTCVTCEVDNTVSPSAANKYACESSNPFCNSGKCGKCTSDLQCTTGAGHAGIFCDTGSGKCLPGCTDGSCGSLEWCALKNATAGQCSAKIANGSAVPANSAGADSGAGKCTPVVGLRVCLSGACDVDDNLCGLSNGKTCTAVPALDAGSGDAGALPTSQCRTGACQPDGKCGVATDGACTVNAECRSNSCVGNKCVATSCTTDANCGGATSGFICMSNLCVEGCRGASGNGCPSDQVCTSTSSTAGTCEPATTFDGGTPTEPTDDDSGVEETPDSSTTVKDSGSGGSVAVGEELEGGGISCSSTNSVGGSLFALFGVVGVAVGAMARRRRR